MTNQMPDSQGTKTGLGIAKAVVSTIPGLGGLAAELLDTVIRPQIEQRQTDWFNSLAERLAMLEDHINGFRVADLVDHPAFISAVIHASDIAVRNHSEEKRSVLRNAVLNVAISSTPLDSSTPLEDESGLFLSLIDRFVPWHLRILELLADKAGTAAKRDKPLPLSWNMGGVVRVLEHVYPELKERRSFYDLIVSDLNRAGLVTIAATGLHTTVTRHGWLEKDSSDMGDRFLALITEPDST